MKNRVGHFSHHYFELSENWIHTQVKHLPDWEKIVFTNLSINLDTVDWKPEIYDRSREISFGFRLLDTIFKKGNGYYPSFYLKAKRKNVHLLHAHFGPMGYLCSGIARRLDVPLITTFYGYDVSKLPKEKPGWKRRYRKLFDQGRRFLVEGQAMGKKLESLGCPPEKITVHHLGIELDKYELQNEYISNNSLRILMVGRFVEKKGFIYGLKAFHNFLKSGGSGSLTIVGDNNGTQESYQIKKELLEYVDEHGLDDSVSFPGLIPLQRLQKEYRNFDLFLAPSIEAQDGDDEGGAPVTIIEASASGIPVIGSRHCDIPEVVKHEDTGLLADEKDVETLTKQLFHLYQNPELRRRFGRTGANYIRENFGAEKQGQILSGIYRDCLKGV